MRRYESLLEIKVREKFNSTAGVSTIPFGLSYIAHYQVTMTFRKDAVQKAKLCNSIALCQLEVTFFCHLNAYV